MALRSVVLVPPPGAGGPRSTVVLRPGGPKDKGKAVDVVACILGILLLLACVLLINILPDKEYALPQFSVTYPETLTEGSSSSFDFVEGSDATRIHVFSYDLPDNVFSITVNAFFADTDLPGSLPDQFRVELFDPSGTPVGQRVDLFTGAPVFKSPGVDNLTQQPEYVPGEVLAGRINFAVGLHPEEEIVQGLSHREVTEQVHARIEPQHRIATAGTWTVKVTLVQAGDCPAPGPDVDPQQALFCRMLPEPSDGTDTGNRFAIEQFIYTTYKVQVEEL